MDADDISKLVELADSLVFEKTGQHLETVEKDILRQTLSFSCANAHAKLNGRAALNGSVSCPECCLYALSWLANWYGVTNHLAGELPH